MFLFLKDAELIAGETIAIDGTKSRAQQQKPITIKEDRQAQRIYPSEVSRIFGSIGQNDIQENPVAIKISNKNKAKQNLTP